MVRPLSRVRSLRRSRYGDGIRIIRPSFVEYPRFLTRSKEHEVFMRVQIIGSTWKRLSFERFPACNAYFDWGYRPASKAWSLLEIGKVWISW